MADCCQAPQKDSEYFKFKTFVSSVPVLRRWPACRLWINGARPHACHASFDVPENDLEQNACYSFLHGQMLQHCIAIYFASAHHINASFLFQGCRPGSIFAVLHWLQPQHPLAVKLLRSSALITWERRWITNLFSYFRRNPLVANHAGRQCALRMIGHCATLRPLAAMMHDPALFWIMTQNKAKAGRLAILGPHTVNPKLVNWGSLSKCPRFPNKSTTI